MNRFKLMRARWVWMGAFASYASVQGAAMAQGGPPPDQPAPPAPAPPPPTTPPPPTAGGPAAPPPAAPAAEPAVVAPAPAPPTPAEPPAPAAEEKATEPFAFGDFTWLNGSNRQTQGAARLAHTSRRSFLLDVNYTASDNNPIDNTVVGSTALSRNNEITLAFLGFGGDFHYEHARARLMTQFGVRSDARAAQRRQHATAASSIFRPRSATSARPTAATTGTSLHGINLDAGIFMSYVGLFSYDNFENWMYLPSFTSDNTPWFFNGMRLQIFPSDKLKIEPWLINGWQTYGKFNEMPGFGAQILWRPTEWLSVLSNDYVGWDTQDAPGSHALPQRQQPDRPLLP